MQPTEFDALIQVSRRRLAANELDDQQFLSWIMGGGGVYLDKPAQPDRPTPEAEVAVLRKEVARLCRLVAEHARAARRPLRADFHGVVEECHGP